MKPRVAPRLPEAKCLDRKELFDATICSETGRVDAETLEARRAAKAICTTCPELEPCRSYLAALPPRQRPRGVVAGCVIELPRKQVS